MYQPGSANAPSSTLVVIHFLTGGVVFWVAALLALMFPESFTVHYFNPMLLSITHLLVLGWMTMIIYGALYQLIPVILQVKLYSETLGYIAYVLLLSGTVLLAYAFATFRLGMVMYVAANALGAGVLSFGINLFLTAQRTKNESIEKDFILTAVVWLMFTVAAGIALAINLAHPYLSVPHLELLKLHAHAGLAGWFLQLIIGVGSKLLPMFMVSHGLKQMELKPAYYFINAGLILLICGLFTDVNWLQMAGGLGIATGVVLFITFLIRAYRHRVRRVLDAGMKQSVAALLVLPAAVLPAAWFLSESLGWPRVGESVAIAYGVMVLAGFISGLILGQTFKTLPFIVWLRTYKSKVGKEKIPLPRELYSERLLQWQFGIYSLAIPILLIGVLSAQTSVISLGAALTLTTATIYNINVLKIILHKPVNNG
jgi:cbb3-type cytochrome oxidase subunit 1